jgi:hypothetical protein
MIRKKWNRIFRELNEIEDKNTIKIFKKVKVSLQKRQVKLTNKC